MTALGRVKTLYDSTFFTGTNWTDLTDGGATTLHSHTGGGGFTTPGGRLTLTTAVPVLTSDVSAAGTVYYAMYTHDQIPIYDGATWTNTTFTELSNILANSAVGSAGPAAATADSAYDLFVWSNSGTMTLTRGPNWTTAATITVTIAVPAVVTWTSHGLHEASPVIFTTTGALPTGITAGTVYYVGRSPAVNTFNISTTVANAAVGTFITTTGTQSGTHTGTNRDSVRGTGTALVRQNGILLNDAAITNGPGASRGVYVGTIRTDSTGAQVDWELGGNAANGDPGFLYVWNMYNRVLVNLSEGDTTDSWTYGTDTYRATNNSSTNRISMVRGLNEDGVFVVHQARVVGDGSNALAVGVGLDSVTTRSGLGSQGSTSSTVETLPQGVYSGFPGIGFHFLSGIERASGGSPTVYGDAANTRNQLGLAFTGLF